MIWNAEQLKTMDEFKNMDESILQMKLDAIEEGIRSYTNNNFQNRNVRFNGQSMNGLLIGSSTFLKVGDTIQISQSRVNDGLYVIKSIDDEFITLDSPLFNGTNTVTKVEYPADVKKGVLDLMIWEVTNRQKVGIQSESISRHSVTYFNQDANNQVMGYPTSLLGFLAPYRKARF